MPAGVTVLLRQPDVTGDGLPEPVMVEYAAGSGRVIASMVTTEQRYSSNKIRSLKLLANELAYAISISPEVEPTILNSHELLEALIAEVEGLALDGILRAGNANSLIGKLMAALSSLESDRTNPAVNQIRSYIREVRALVRSGGLDPGTGDQLILAADQIIAGLLAE